MFKKFNLYYYIIIKSFAPLNKGMYCTKKFYILIIIRGFNSIKNGLNSKFYVKNYCHVCQDSPKMIILYVSCL